MSCCMPVPDAPTMPMEPRGATLLKPSPTPLMMAVPQSGPMSSSPLLAARALRRRSCSMETLLLKRNTCSPWRSACSASSQACSPATEITARLAVPSCRSAVSNERAGSVDALPAMSRLPGAASFCSAKVRAAWADASSFARMAMSRSSGPGFFSCSARKATGSRPASSNNARFASVAMTAPPSSTSPLSFTCCTTDMRAIES